MDLEEQYAVALGAICVVLLALSVLVGRKLSDAPARVIRTYFPVIAMLTFAIFAVFVFIARSHVKG